MRVIRAGMETRDILARFESERQALAIMNHPNIAVILDVGTTDQGRRAIAAETEARTIFEDMGAGAWIERLDDVVAGDGAPVPPAAVSRS